jgi:hypothetical protein
MLSPPYLPRPTRPRDPPPGPLPVRRTALISTDPLPSTSPGLSLAHAIPVGRPELFPWLITLGSSSRTSFGHTAHTGSLYSRTVPTRPPPGQTRGHYESYVAHPASGLLHPMSQAFTVAHLPLGTTVATSTYVPRAPAHATPIPAVGQQPIRAPGFDQFFTPPRAGPRAAPD